MNLRYSPVLAWYDISSESYHKSEFFSYHVSQILSHEKSGFLSLISQNISRIFNVFYWFWEAFFHENKVKKWSGFQWLIKLPIWMPKESKIWLSGSKWRWYLFQNENFHILLLSPLWTWSLPPKNWFICDTNPKKSYHVLWYNVIYHVLCNIRPTLTI